MAASPWLRNTSGIQVWSAQVKHRSAVRYVFSPKIQSDRSLIPVSKTPSEEQLSSYAKKNLQSSSGLLLKLCVFPSIYFLLTDVCQGFEIWPQIIQEHQIIAHVAEWQLIQRLATAALSLVGVLVGLVRRPGFKVPVNLVHSLWGLRKEKKKDFSVISVFKKSLMKWHLILVLVLLIWRYKTYFFILLSSVTVLCCMSDTLCNVLLLPWPGLSLKEILNLNEAFPG